MPGGPDRQFTFAFDKLADAIRLTFKQRSTELAEPIDAFSEAFTKSCQPPWSTFRRRLKQEHLPESFVEITAEVESFIKRDLAAARKRFRTLHSFQRLPVNLCLRFLGHEKPW